MSVPEKCKYPLIILILLGGLWYAGIIGLRAAMGAWSEYCGQAFMEDSARIMMDMEFAGEAFVDEKAEDISRRFMVLREYEAEDFVPTIYPAPDFLEGMRKHFDDPEYSGLLIKLIRSFPEISEILPYLERRVPIAAENMYGHEFRSFFQAISAYSIYLAEKGRFANSIFVAERAVSLALIQSLGYYHHPSSMDFFIYNAYVSIFCRNIQDFLGRYSGDIPPVYLHRLKRGVELLEEHYPEVSRVMEGQLLRSSLMNREIRQLYPKTMIFYELFFGNTDRILRRYYSALLREYEEKGHDASINIMEYTRLGFYNPLAIADKSGAFRVWNPLVDCGGMSNVISRRGEALEVLAETKKLIEEVKSAE